MIRRQKANTALPKGDVVFCKVGGAKYLHLVKAIRNGAYRIDNSRGGINGWTSRANIFGRYVPND